jgi:hypothetical protein
MIKKLLSFFAVFFYAAADDKAVMPATVNTNLAAANVLEGLVGSSVKFTNILGSVMLPYNDSVCGEKKLPIVFCRTSPVGDADYAGLALGAIVLQTEVTSSAISNLDIFVKRGSGASDYMQVVMAPVSGYIPAYTAAKNMLYLRGTNSGTGDFQAVYGRVNVSHASAGSADALRGYATTTGGAIALRGAHLTAEISTAGSVTGLATGVTAQVTTASGLTLNTGSIYCVNAITNNESSLLGVPDSAHIRIADEGTYGMTNILSLGTIVGRSTSASALGPYTYVSGGMTAAATAARVAFRVKTADGTFYILGWASGNISAT